MRNFLAICILSFALISCSSKKEEFDKPAMYWYEEIFKEIRYGNLESADTKFASLQSEHINSPLIADAMLALGHAHMAEEEFVLAEFYFDEYLKRYSNQENYSYLNYLKLLARFNGFKNQSKDQSFMLESLEEIKAYLDAYPDDTYTPYVAYIYTKFQLGMAELNAAIANVYKNQGKKYAEQEYLKRGDSSLQNGFRRISNATPWYMLDAIEMKKIDYILPSYVPWYVMIFSW